MIRNRNIATREIQSTTFVLEDLSLPKNLLDEKPAKEILDTFSSKIEASYKAESNLVSRGYHSFISGMYHAYAEHRPFTISPDMIWLLVCQGYSNHVNFSHGTAQDLFPELTKKQKIVVRDDRIVLGNPNSPWDETPEQFTAKIKDILGEELIDILKADFSTSTITEKVACDITIMDAFKEYFEYILMMCICGIPKITLEGEAKDWEKMIHKLKQLGKFGVSWWTTKLIPIIEEFVAASKGTINKEFWMNMFKVHTENSYGNPKHIDGWILNFYPYDRDGNVLNIGSIKKLDVDKIFKELPREIVTVDFIYQIQDGNGNIIEEKDMEYWAGFIGLQQNKNDFTLRPEIGWFVSHKEKESEKEAVKQDKYAIVSFYNVKEIPPVLYTKKEWEHIILNFTNEVEIPLKLATLKIDVLELNGRISTANKLKLKTMFAMKEMRLILNGEHLK